MAASFESECSAFAELATSNPSLIQATREVDFCISTPETNFAYMKDLIMAESNERLDLMQDAARGRYVVAAVPLKAGDVILTTPVVTFKKTSDLGVALLLPQILARLPDLYRLQPRTRAPKTAPAVLGSLFGNRYVAKAVSVVWNNCFEGRMEDGSATCELSVTGSMFQHSCKFNTRMYNSDAGDAVVYIATRDVCVGDELFVCYVECSALEPWGFNCPEELHETHMKEGVISVLKMAPETLRKFSAHTTPNIRMPNIDSSSRFYNAVLRVTPFADRANVTDFGSQLVQAFGESLDYDGYGDPWPLLHTAILNPEFNIGTAPV